MADESVDRRSAAAAQLEFDRAQDPFCRDSIEHLVACYGSPLFLIDANRVRRQYRELAVALPGVDLHYAIKSLPHAAVVSTLMDEGASFDLATNGEVELARRLRVPPTRCIHTHPIKRDSDIRTALSFGVNRFVIDNPDELRKFVKYRNRSSLLIRLTFSSTDARTDLSRKFGCEPDAVPQLLQLAEQLRVQIDGLSFHVGSRTETPGVFVEAIDACRELLRVATARGHAATVLDIGGGFPIKYRQGGVLRCGMPIEEFCAPIRLALLKLPRSIRVIAEPGRYIAAPCAISVTSVMGRALRAGRWWYYLDDGLYGSYSGQVFDHAQYTMETLLKGDTYPSVLAGPTCDSIDVIDDTLELPLLDVGDIVIGRVMGAYTWASSTEFNFFPRATVLALDNGRLIT